MARREKKYNGPSWDELAATQHADGRLWARFVPVEGPGVVLLRATFVGDFRTGGVFLARCVMTDGREVSLHGHCRRLSNQPMEYVRSA